MFTMSWLFGDPKEEKEKQNIEDAMRVVDTQIDIIDKRMKELKVKIANAMEEARAIIASKDQSTLAFIKIKKDLAKQELEKLSGMRTVMEKQKAQLEGLLDMQIL